MCYVQKNQGGWYLYRCLTNSLFPCEFVCLYFDEWALKHAHKTRLCSNARTYCRVKGACDAESVQTECSIYTPATCAREWGTGLAGIRQRTRNKRRIVKRIIKKAAREGRIQKRVVTLSQRIAATVTGLKSHRRARLWQVGRLLNTTVGVRHHES